MAILPVLDLMDGQIVRGVAGRRSEYRPIVSELVDSAAPLAVAKALREHFGFTEFYLADLDALVHGRMSPSIYRALTEAGFRLWIDAGVRTAEDRALDVVLDHASAVIVGLESLRSPIDLSLIAQRAGQRTVFSLDLKAGLPLTESRLMPQDPEQIAEVVITEHGVRRLIVLDLACVGVGAGVGTEDLCRRLRKSHPDVQLIAGGGVRGIEDVKRLINLGVDHVLVASALHDGRINPVDARPFIS